MGVNAPGIEQIIHCRPPTTMGAYLQEIGRAGRADQQLEQLCILTIVILLKTEKAYLMTCVSSACMMVVCDRS